MTPFFPQPLEDRVTLVRRNIVDAAVAREVGSCAGGFSGALEDRLVVLLDRRLVLRCEGGLASGDREVWRALEDGEVLRFGRNDRGGLDAGRAGSDQSDPIALEIDAVLGPARGVAELAFKAVESGNVEQVCDRQAADYRDQVAGRDPVAVFCADLPAALGVVEALTRHPGRQLNAPAQVEAIGQVIEIAFDLGLLGVLAGPLPFLCEVGVERKTVVEALAVTARAGTGSSTRSRRLRRRFRRPEPPCPSRCGTCGLRTALRSPFR